MPIELILAAAAIVVILLLVLACRLFARRRPRHRCWLCGKLHRGNGSSCRQCYLETGV